MKFMFLFTQLSCVSTIIYKTCFMYIMSRRHSVSMIDYDIVLSCVCTVQVETIGDAYMVSSGIPVPNPQHASELADMALTLCHGVTEFKVMSQTCSFAERLADSSKTRFQIHFVVNFRVDLRPLLFSASSW